MRIRWLISILCLIPILAGIAVVGSLALEGGMDPFSTVLIIIVVSLFANPGVTLLVICMVPVLVVGVLQVFFARKTDTVLKADPDKAEFYKKASAELRAAEEKLREAMKSFNEWLATKPKGTEENVKKSEGFKKKIDAAREDVAKVEEVIKASQESHQSEQVDY